MNIRDRGNAGMIFRFNDQFNFYRININSQGIIFSKMIDGFLTIIKEIDLAFE